MNFVKYQKRVDVYSTFVLLQALSTGNGKFLTYLKICHSSFAEVWTIVSAFQLIADFAAVWFCCFAWRYSIKVQFADET